MHFSLIYSEKPTAKVTDLTSVVTENVWSKLSGL